MRFGHCLGSDGPELFVERDGKPVLVRSLVRDAPPTLDALIRAGDGWSASIARALSDGARGEVAAGRRMSPLLAPGSIVAIGLNYLDHCREFGSEPPSTPIVFAKLPSSVCGDGDALTWSQEVTSAVDWEVELGVVIGAPAHNVAPEDAREVIFGYTVVNDVTARDVQRAEQQWVRAKSLDTFCPMGPVVVTRDEIPDPQALRIRSRLNGEPMQDSTTGEMIFSVAELVARLSRSFTLHPGDVVATGTPLGVGAFRTPPAYLSDGDVIEVEIDEIGVLRNPCRVLSAAIHEEQQ